MPSVLLSLTPLPLPPTPTLCRTSPQVCVIPLGYGKVIIIPVKDKRQIQVSVEVEKPREELYQLFGYGDVFKKKKERKTKDRSRAWRISKNQTFRSSRHINSIHTSMGLTMPWALF